MKALGVTSLYLFGSALRDEIGPASDVDVFVDYDPQGPFNAFDLVAAKRHLEEQLGVRVDLTTRRGLHPLIRAEVEKTALRVF
ncbi:nucleotidyltransferase family protein [Rhodoplanes elegans]|uniref:nucleotidyltransferase family protein n=1 Tax=Rhodoplanes elegans TaxID=29408 RepID=UPI003083FAFC